MSIDIITGCMFSGKTTELMHRVTQHLSIGQSVVVINHSIDTRYGDTKSITSHDGKSLKAWKVERLYDVDDKVKICNVVAIDEAQFFPDLVPYVLKWCDVYKKKVIVAGLMTDYKREKFGEISDLIHFSDSVTHKTAYCSQCANGKRAIFTKKMSFATVQIDVGSTDKYIPLCRSCYLKV